MKTKFKLFTLFVIMCALIVSGCHDDYLNLPEAPANGYGINLSVNISNTRTILPILGITELKITFYYDGEEYGDDDGEEYLSETWVVSEKTSDKINLDKGTYKLVVEGLSAEKTVIAKAELDITVPTVDFNVNIDLVPLADGPGTFAWVLTGAVLGITDIKLDIFDDDEKVGETRVLRGSVTTPEEDLTEVANLNLPSGVYSLVFELSDGTSKITWMETLHIYKGLTSAFAPEWTLDFFNRTAIATAAFNAINDAIDNEDFSGIVLGHFTAIGIDGVDNAEKLAAVINVIEEHVGPIPDVDTLKLLADIGIVNNTLAGVTGPFADQDEVEEVIEELLDATAPNGTVIGAITWDEDVDDETTVNIVVGTETVSITFDYEIPKITTVTSWSGMTVGSTTTARLYSRFQGKTNVLHIAPTGDDYASSNPLRSDWLNPSIPKFTIELSMDIWLPEALGDDRNIQWTTDTESANFPSIIWKGDLNTEEWVNIVTDTPFQHDGVVGNFKAVYLSAGQLKTMEMYIANLSYTYTPDENFYQFGPPEIVGNTLVHNNPQMTTSNDFAVFDPESGFIAMSGENGRWRYKLPGGFDLTAYNTITIHYTARNVSGGARTNFKPGYDDWGNLETGRQQNIVEGNGTFTILLAEISDGFGCQVDGTYEILITSIVFSFVAPPERITLFQLSTNPVIQGMDLGANNNVWNDVNGLQGAGGNWEVVDIGNGKKGVKLTSNGGWNGLDLQNATFNFKLGDRIVVIAEILTIDSGGEIYLNGGDDEWRPIGDNPPASASSTITLDRTLDGTVQQDRWDEITSKGMIRLKINSSENFSYIIREIIIERPTGE